MSLYSVVHYDADGSPTYAGTSTEQRDAEDMLAIVARYAPDGYWHVEERPDVGAGYMLALALADARLEYRLAERALSDEAQRRKAGKLNAQEADEQERRITRLTVAMIAERTALDAWEQHRAENPKPKGDSHE